MLPGEPWMVATAMGGTQHRRWSMPAGRPLFVPALWAISLPVLFLGRSPRLGALEAFVELDGVGLELVEVPLRQVPLSLAPGNPFVDAESPMQVRACVTGLWVLTEPLAAGNHELRYGGMCRDGFAHEVTAQIEALAAASSGPG